MHSCCRVGNLLLLVRIEIGGVGSYYITRPTKDVWDTGGAPPSTQIWRIGRMPQVNWPNTTDNQWAMGQFDAVVRSPGGAPGVNGRHGFVLRD